MSSQMLSNQMSLFPAADFLEGEIRGASLPDGTRIAIYNINGVYYVTDDTCTHESASLSEEGLLDGASIVCGWHFCAFDIATGQAMASPCSEPIRTYPVTVIDGVLHVDY
jgi:nitrite reductase/ring-hydroxylating ferredoxin subunit